MALTSVVAEDGGYLRPVRAAGGAHLGVANFVRRVGQKRPNAFRHTHTALGEGTARGGVNRMEPK